MLLINKILYFFKYNNWKKFFYRIQLISAYVPLFFVPFIFSPYSADPFYIEKLLTILGFSAISIFAYAISYFFVSEKNGKTIPNTLTFGYTSVIKYLLLTLGYVFFTQMLSVNFNQSFWGVGTAAFFAITLWCVAIYQVFDYKKIILATISSITLVSLSSLIVLITRFAGEGNWSIIRPFVFSPTGDLQSILPLLFIGIYFCLKYKDDGKFRYLYLGGLFVNSIAFIVFAYVSQLFILLYVLLGAMYLFYFIDVRKIFIKNSKQKKEKIVSKSFLKEWGSDKIITMVILVSSILISAFELILQKDFIVFNRNPLPFNFSWNVFVTGITDNVKNFLVGIGANNYNYAFIHYKPNSINETSFLGNEYFSSNSGGLEIILSFGFLFIIIALFIYLKKNKFKFSINSVWRNIIKKDLFDTLFVISIIFFIFSTPIVISTLWIFFVLIIIKVGKPLFYDINFSSVHSPAKRDLQNLLLGFIVILMLPILYFSIVFEWSSFKISTAGVDIGKNDNAIKRFPYYPKTYSMYVTNLQSITDENQLTPALLKSREIAKNAYVLNPNDPYSFSIVANSLTEGNYDANSLALATDFYVKQIINFPNHMPYYLSLADVYFKLSNYTSASQVLDEAMKLNPNFDSLLIRKANAMFLQNKLDEAKIYASKTIQVSNNNELKTAAQNILKRIEEVRGD